MTQRLVGDTHVDGTLTAKALNIPSGTVDNSDVQGGAGIEASKLEHQFQKEFAQESSATPTTETKVVHVVRGATADFVSFACGMVDTGTSGSVTVDVKKNGTSILSSPVTVDFNDADRAILTGTITTTTAVVGDVIEITITDSSSDGSGAFGQIVIREDAA